MSSQPQASVEQLPTFASARELDQHIEETYGPEVLETLRSSSADQATTLEELHRQGLNGRAEPILHTYRLQNQEFERKETLLGKTWNAVTWPFRAAWGFAKKHPVVTTLAVAAAVAAGVYFLWGTPIPIPNPSIPAGDVAREIAAPTGGAFDALPQGEIVPPNLSEPYVPDAGALPDILPPEPTGAPGEWFTP